MKDKLTKGGKMKTYQKDFLEKNPKAITDKYGVPITCRNAVYGLNDGLCNRRPKCSICWQEKYTEKQCAKVFVCVLVGDSYNDFVNNLEVAFLSEEKALEWVKEYNEQMSTLDLTAIVQEVRLGDVDGELVEIPCRCKECEQNKNNICDYIGCYVKHDGFCDAGSKRGTNG